MPELVVLGTAASVPDAHHDTIAHVLCGDGWTVLVDCGGSPLHKLAQLGIEADTIQAVILTHYHADHIYGLPILIQGLWLGSREAPLPIFGPEHTLGIARQMLETFSLAERADMFTLEWQPVRLREGEQVLELDGTRILATPVCHREVPALGLRFENTETGRAIVYSGDTEPCPPLVRLAFGADLLIHDSTGEQYGHSSPEQAAEVAREAGVQELALIHYPVQGVNLQAWRQAASEFPGPVRLASDGDRYPL
jgi:ribonuclease Z